MKHLFTTLHLKTLTIPNRIVVSPMCQYSATEGFANDWHLVHLGQFAIGKAGAIIQEATAVVPEGRISYSDLGIWSDEHIEFLTRITSFIKSQGTIPGIQLSHAGRKASGEKPWLGRKQFAPTHENGWQTVGPSEIPFNENDLKPHALTIAEIEEIVIAFKQATVRAIKAGYEIIEIHGAHGYLFHQFLSPLINDRKDNYGGSFENRIRFLIEVIDAIKPILTTQSLWVRISADDWAAGGWSLEESVKLAKILQEKGVEVIDVSSGGAVSFQKIKVEPNYQVHFAEKIKKETNLIVGTVGLIKSGQQAEEILEHDKADFVLVGRQFLRDPHFVLQAAADLNVDIPWANQYDRAKN
ncbi:NADH:flavin oxidoreductase/NADH oxidase [Myroides injenensis]|uniref:NADH:flavin oxidoreductase/NADH oxidase n=1 Tax=Myroides injenensis TaxID=1183151 RepID=UPI0002898DF6|nr:NADH:flavin oxidoreductase/NADH oxidase [Myroides injenensis]